MIERTNRHRSIASWAALGLATIAAGGCHWLSPDRCADLPPGAISAPPGAAIQEWASAQAQRAEVDDFVVYEADWVAGGAELGPAARRRVASVAERVGYGESPLILSPSGNDQLDADRRFKLQDHLATCGCTSHQDSVQIGWPEALDLLGRDAPGAVREMLSPRVLPNSPIGGEEGVFGGGAIANPFGGTP